jgi:hypothetical protein
MSRQKRPARKRHLTDLYVRKLQPVDRYEITLPWAAPPPPPMKRAG